VNTHNYLKMELEHNTECGSTVLHKTNLDARNLLNT